MHSHSVEWRTCATHKEFWQACQIGSYSGLYFSKLDLHGGHAKAKNNVFFIGLMDRI